MDKRKKGEIHKRPLHTTSFTISLHGKEEEEKSESKKERVDGGGGGGGMEAVIQWELSTTTRDTDGRKVEKMIAEALEQEDELSSSLLVSDSERRESKTTTSDRERLVNRSDQELLRMAQKWVEKTNSTDLVRHAAEADLVLQVLATRKLKDSHQHLYRQLTDLFCEKTGLRRCEDWHSLEVVGVRLERDGPLVRIYGPLMEDVWKRWQESSLSCPVYDYWRRHATTEEWQDAKEYRVRYLSKSEQADYEATFDRKTGQVSVGTQSRVVKLKPGVYMFVLDAEEQRLLIAKEQRGRFHHTSLVNGAPAASAGSLKIDRKGRIKALRNDSGHFRPGIGRLYRVVRFLAHPMRLGSDAAQRIRLQPIVPP